MSAPYLPAGADDATLAARIGAGSLQLGLAPTTAQLDRFVAYIRLIQQWNATYNLTAVRGATDMVSHHVLDSLAAAAAIIRARGAGAGKRLLDVGTGAGLPGLIIAAVSPEREVVCIDSVGKKTAFVRQATALLQLKNVTVLTDRVERLAGPAYDEIISRAFAALIDFMKTTRQLLKQDGVWIAMKAKVAAAELERLPLGSYNIESLQVPGLAAERCLVWMKREASAR